MTETLRWGFFQKVFQGEILCSFDIGEIMLGFYFVSLDLRRRKRVKCAVSDAAPSTGPYDATAKRCCAQKLISSPAFLLSESLHAAAAAAVARSGIAH